jgi:hypothetical protein
MRLVGPVHQARDELPLRFGEWFSLVRELLDRLDGLQGVGVTVVKIGDGLDMGCEQLLKSRWYRAAVARGHVELSLDAPGYAQRQTSKA